VLIYRLTDEVPYHIDTITIVVDLTAGGENQGSGYAPPPSRATVVIGNGD
jgi:hypothetical protein